MKDLIIVRGGGDLATGTIYKLKKSGFPVLILEVKNPSAIRRNVASGCYTFFCIFPVTIRPCRY